VANFGPVHANSTYAPEIRDSHIKFSMNFTAEIGDFSQFHLISPWLHSNVHKSTNKRPKKSQSEGKIVDFNPWAQFPQIPNENFETIA
jgi:hypothetical protein